MGGQLEYIEIDGVRVEGVALTDTETGGFLVPAEIMREVRRRMLALQEAAERWPSME